MVVLSVALGRMLVLLGIGSLAGITLGVAASRLFSASSTRRCTSTRQSCSANNNVWEFARLMEGRMLLPIHVAAGGLAIVLGAVALLAKKGGTIHRRSGLLFVYAMLVMGATASILGNVGGGLMTAYFAGTALTTVRPVSRWTRRINVAALTVAVGLALV